jgi:hypothetical protein
MTSQGSAHGRFARAIRERNVFMAELAARELRGLALNDALDLCVLIAEMQPDRFYRRDWSRATSEAVEKQDHQAARPH